MKKNVILSVIATAAIAIIVLSVIIVNTYGKTENNKLDPADSSVKKAPDEPDNIYERNIDVKDPLRIGVINVSIPPMIMWDSNDPGGFEIDFIAETARRLGVSYEIVPIDPALAREKLENGEIDAVWGVPDTDKQKQNYIMTDPYIKMPQVTVIYGGSEIKDKNGIKNISVIMSTPAETLADEDKINIDYKRVSASKDYIKTFEQLREGYSDAVICDRATALYMQDSDDKLMIIDENAAEIRYSVAFLHTEEKMRNAVNGVIKDILNDGTLPELSIKWLRENYYNEGKLP